MKTNTLSKIAVKNTSYPRTMLPASNDLNTTAQFGDFQPIKFKRMLADSSMTVRMKDLVRAAPLVAPSFARLQQKVYSYFVPYSDLTQNYTHMMAQQPVRRGSTTFVPTNIATVSKKYLSSLILIGSKCTIYEDSDGDASAAHFSELYDCPAALTAANKNTASALGTPISNVISNVGSFFAHSAGNAVGTAFGFGSSQDIFYLRLKGIFPSLSSTQRLIPIANDSWASFFNVDPSSPYYTGSLGVDLETVPLSNRAADILLPVSFTDSSSVTHYFTFAFRLSSFGKRLKKIIQGLGYGIDFTSDEPLDFLAVIGFFKAYFEGFAPKLYDSYETTHAYNLQWYADQAVTNWNMDLLYDDVASNDFWQFIIDLGQCFYTDEQDFVSAHIRVPTVSSSPQGFINTVQTSVNGGSANVNQSYDTSTESAVVSGNSRHAEINAIYHGQLDSELLKKLYKWTNRNTIAGRKIEDLLRAQGLGPYVDSLKSHFIGYADHMIPVDDVTSQADTFDSSTNTGALLGEQNGKAVQYFESDSWTYETKEAGYWFTLMTVVPVSGYCEQQDPTSSAVSKWTMYNPEFDGLGYEFTRKSVIHGSMHWQDFDTAGSGSLDNSFGLIPRYSGWKITNNLLNGDFALRSRQNAMLPYTLDKFIDVGERYVDDGTSTSTGTVYSVQKTFTCNDLPIAGTSWRYLTKYPFIGLYTRIFANVGTSKATAQNWFVYAANWTFFSNQVDHFIVQGIFDGKYYAPVLPMADSFETKDEGNEGKANGAMTKA